MKDYINTALQRFQHARPSKPTHSTHPLQRPTYGATTQHAPEPHNYLPLSPTETTKLQVITGNLLNYARAADNKMLVALGSIATQMNSPTLKL